MNFRVGTGKGTDKCSTSTAPASENDDFYTAKNLGVCEIHENEEENNTAQISKPEDGDNLSENRD